MNIMYMFMYLDNKQRSGGQASAACACSVVLRHVCRYCMSHLR